MPDRDDSPVGWIIAKLGELVQPSKEKVEPSGVADEPYLSLEHIEPGSCRILGHGMASEVRSTKSVFRPGDVLYGKLRPYLNKVCRPDFAWVCSTDILVFPCANHVDGSYLMRFLSTPHVVEYADHHSAGVQLPRVSFSALAELDFPLPPLAEQKRIVAKVEELLAQVNAARERLARVPAILKRFRQSILAAACSGRLTEGWRAEQSSFRTLSEALREAITEREEREVRSSERRRSTKGRVEEVGSEKANHLSNEIPTGELHPLPDDWVWARLGLLGEHQACTVQTGPFGAQLHNDEFTESGVPVIAVGNLTGMGFTREGLYYISPKKAEQLRRYDVVSGDVMFARSGATLGKVCVAPPYVDDWRMTGHILRVRLDKSLAVPAYVVYALHADRSVMDQVSGSIRGITRPGFNATLLLSILLPLPPLSEQLEIVHRVEAMLGLVGVIEERALGGMARGEKLTKAILAKAFRGELVPTEADLARAESRLYEPASALLARIRESRTLGSLSESSWLKRAARRSS